MLLLLGDAEITEVSLARSLSTQGYPMVYSKQLKVSAAKLVTLDVSSNSQLQTLDVSECPALKTLKTRGCKYGSMIIKMSRAQEGVVSVEKDSPTKIEYVD